MNGDHTVINALKQGLPTPQLADTALERPAATGPYYLSAPTNAAGPSKTNATIKANATQMKRALSEASSRFAAGRKKAKGDMDPVGIPQPQFLPFKCLQEPA